MKQLTPRWIALVTITAITLYVTWLMFQPFLNVVLWAIVLTVIAAPIYRMLSPWIRNSNLCALATLVVVLIAVVLPLTLIGQAVISRADDASRTFGDAIDKLTNPDAPHIRWLNQYIDVQKHIQPEAIRQQASRIGKYLAGFGADIAGYVVVLLMQFLLVLFTTYYMLRDGGKLLLSLRDLLPLNKVQADQIITSVQTIISASLRGTVFIAAIQGILGGLAFWALGVPAPALWGVVMFFMSLVPVVGSSVIWVPAAIYLAMGGSPIKALILVVWGVGVIAMVDNILRPVLVGSKTRMHELTVFFSVLGGLKLFGPVGIIMGPIVIALAAGLLKIFEESAEGSTPEGSAQAAVVAIPVTAPQGASTPSSPTPANPEGNPGAASGDSQRMN